MSTITFKRTSLACALLLCTALAACGGGDGGTTSGSTSTGGTTGGTTTGGTGGSTGGTSTTVTGTLTTPQYTASSAQLAALTQLNQYRTQCGFPALQENTVLDQAAQAHAKYMGLNNAVSDSEVSSNQGYTGATYVDRAVAAGFPSNVLGVGVSGGYATTSASFTAQVAGQNFVYSLLAGVYHSVVAAYPVNTVGIGEYETQTTSGSYTYTQSWDSMSLFNTQAQAISNGPLTFPCQGVTGVAYKSISGEIPTPPNVSASGWGTPVVVMGNPGADKVLLTSATMADTTGTVISLQILNSTNDPNKLVQPEQAVAYPASPLQPNTQYSGSPRFQCNNWRYANPALARGWCW
ncbi:CAP domain-containing protein [Ralstonia thomasii]